MEKLHKTMNTYVQAMAKRCESDNKEKTLPITAMGSTMVAHGGDFEPDSDFGRCLTGETTQATSNSRYILTVSQILAEHTSDWEDYKRHTLTERPRHGFRASKSHWHK